MEIVMALHVTTAYSFSYIDIFVKTIEKYFNAHSTAMTGRDLVPLNHTLWRLRNGSDEMAGNGGARWLASAAVGVGGGQRELKATHRTRDRAHELPNLPHSKILKATPPELRPPVGTARGWHGTSRTGIQCRRADSVGGPEPRAPGREQRKVFLGA